MNNKQAAIFARGYVKKIKETKENKHLITIIQKLCDRLQCDEKKQGEKLHSI